MPEPPRGSAWVDVTGWWFAALGVAFFDYAILQRSPLAELLSASRVELVADERWLFPLAIFGTTLLGFLPAALLATALSLGRRPRAARAAFVGAAAVWGTWLVIDLDLFRSIGRHVTEIVKYALMPGGHEAAGELASWAGLVGKGVGIGIVVPLVFAWGVTRGVERLRDRGRPALARVVAIAVAAAALGIAIVPHAFGDGWRQRGLAERLYGSLPIDARLGWRSATRQSFGDPVLDALGAGLERVYTDAFPALYAARRWTPPALPPRPGSSRT